MKTPLLPSLFLAAVSAALAAPAPRLLENLSRGVIAIDQPDGRVAVSWRLLGTDPEGVACNLYRKSDPIPGGRGGFGPPEGRGAPVQSARGLMGSA
jgi:rhamnogalacturonan endolyase